MENSTYDKSVRIILTSKELYCKPEYELEVLIEKLKYYDRDSVLIVLSKWQLLIQIRGTDNPYWQFKFAQSFLNRSQYKRMRNSLVRKPRQVITKDVVLGLMKLNLEHNENGGNLLTKNSDSKLLFKIMISLNSLYANDILPGVENRSEHRDEILEDHRYQMAKQYLSINSSDVLHEMYRGKRIIDYLDANIPIFKEKFKIHTGLNLEEYYEILFLLLLDWAFPIGNKSLEARVFKNMSEYFSKSSIDLQKVSKVVDIHGLKPEDFVELNIYYTELGNLVELNNPWNFITFFNKQIVELDKGLLCLSPNALTMQLSEGPYNIVRQQLKTEEDEQSLKDLPNWWGEAYESYIMERLRLTFKDKLTASDVTLRNGNKSIDAVIELTDMVLLVEIKYPHWRFASRVNPTKENIKQHVKKFVDNNKGLGQIQKFLEHKANNNLSQEFDFGNKFIVPVLILGEEFPFDPVNRQIITDYAKEKNLLPEGEYILPYIILTSNEVEILEGFAEQHGMDQVRNFLGMYSGAFLESESKPILENPTTLLNIFVMNRVVVQNSTSLKSNLDAFSKNLIEKFEKTT